MKRPEITPFKKFSWRSKAIQEKWEPVKRRIYTATHFAEYEMVKRGLRKCDVYDFGPNNIMWRLKRPTLDGLIFLPMLISESYGGYAHRHYVRDKFGDNTFVYGVVARNLDDAVKFHDAGVVKLKDRIRKWSDMNPRGIDHHITGELLGYPSCCVKWFCEVWLQGGSVDPMYEMALNTENHEVVKYNHIKVMGNPLIMRLARYWGIQGITFFPHSYDCKEAAKFGEVFVELMREHDREATDACLALLEMPMVWSMSNSIIEVQHPLFWGSANGYYRPDKVTVEWYPDV